MKIRELFKRLSKKTKLVAGALVIAGAIAVPAAVLAGYGPNGPDRVIFDFSDPEEREGAFDGPRFNSYINTNVYGDERAFLDTKECVVNGAQCYSQGTYGGYKDKVTVEPGKEYIVRAYVHNIANPSINASGLGVAKNTKFRLEIPGNGGAANGFTLNGTISADNAIPKSVYDTTDLLNSQKSFSLDYIEGSARIFNASHPSGLVLSDDIVSGGALLGDEQMNGNFPGCFEFASFVTVRVKVNAPKLTMDKLVRLDGETSEDWREEVHATTGQKVEYMIKYQNTGTSSAKNIVIKDKLPSNVTLVPGSVKWVDPNRPDGTPVPDGYLFAPAGFGIGNYGVNGGGYIFFEATVNDEVDECVAKNVAFISANNIPVQEDNAVVIIDDCQPEEPVFACDALTATKVDDNTYRFNASHTATNGAEFNRYVYDFGDSTEELVTDDNEVEHTYEEAGTFTATLTVFVNADGKEQSATGTQCMVRITVGEEPENPENPEELPDTGAGDLISIFVATSFAGMVAYRVVLARRYN